VHKISSLTATRYVFYSAGVLLSQKFLLANYDSARDLIEKVFEEMDNDVLINGNTKLTYFDDDSLRITKGNFNIPFRI
jgi:hypothetical protein